MSGRLHIRYSDGNRETELTRPVGPDYMSYTKSGPDRDDLAEAMAAATVELLDAAHPVEKQGGTADPADVWDEGFTALAREHAKQREDPTYPIHRSNPYTKESTRYEGKE